MASKNDPREELAINRLKILLDEGVLWRIRSKIVLSAHVDNMHIRVVEAVPKHRIAIIGHVESMERRNTALALAIVAKVAPSGMAESTHKHRANQLTSDSE
jgi:hypothetical protein